MPEVIISEQIKFGSAKLPLIAGPCVIESRDHSLRMAEKIRSIAEKLEIPFIFKSSFDKANRTALDSYRGPGLDEGLRIFEDIKQKLEIPVTTDIHLPDQADALGQVADIIQIPAFLCRQTDILVAAGNTGVGINIKKGQFLSPQKMRPLVEKVKSTGNTKILLTERGTTFGYSSLVNDMRTIPIMQETGYPVIFDGTHSAQMPGHGNKQTGGVRKYIPVLVMAAVAAGCDGIFLEVHDNVESARSDAATQWPLSELESLLVRAVKIRDTIVSS